jgi:hypothetical protein
MLASNAMPPSDSPTRPAVNHVAVQVPDTQEPAVVRNCNRLGRVANPPGFSLSEWLRERRSRRASVISA